MGTRTVVQLVGAARAQLGLLPISTSVVSSGNDIDTQMLALLNQLGSELQQSHSWTALQTQFIINTETILSLTGDIVAGSAVIQNISSTSGIVANTWVVIGTGIPISARVVSVDSATQITMDSHATSTLVGTALQFSKDTYALPADMESMISDTWWDRTNRWQLLGPTSPQMDQFLRSGIVTTTPRRNWRQIGRPVNAWRIWPPPGTTDPSLDMVWEYNSIYWATDTTGAAIPYCAADTDTTIFPDNLMVAGLKLRYFDAKGFDTSKLLETYEGILAVAQAADGGASTLSMSGPRQQPFLIDYWNIPDNGYGR